MTNCGNHCYLLLISVQHVNCMKVCVCECLAATILCTQLHLVEFWHDAFSLLAWPWLFTSITRSKCSLQKQLPPKKKSTINNNVPVAIEMCNWSENYGYSILCLIPVHVLVYSNLLFLLSKLTYMESFVQDAGPTDGFSSHILSGDIIVILVCYFGRLCVNLPITASLLWCI